MFENKDVSKITSFEYLGFFCKYAVTRSYPNVYPVQREITSGFEPKLIIICWI